jgi:hypothetical protein
MQWKKKTKIIAAASDNIGSAESVAESRIYHIYTKNEGIFRTNQQIVLCKREKYHILAFFQNFH